MKYFFALCFISAGLNIYYAGAAGRGRVEPRLPTNQALETKEQKPLLLLSPAVGPAGPAVKNQEREQPQRSVDSEKQKRTKEVEAKLSAEVLLRKLATGAGDLEAIRRDLSKKMIKEALFAIQEGDMETYNILMEDLRGVYRLRLYEDLLLSKDDSGNYNWLRLLEFMITAKINRNFFNKEMIRLLSVIVISDLSHFPKQPLQKLIKSAKVNDNPAAFSLLSDFDLVISRTREYLYHQNISTKEKLLHLLQQAKHNTSYASAVLYITVSGALTATGYKILSSPVSLERFLPPELLNLINRPDRMAVGAGAVALGVAGLSHSVRICRRAFKKNKKMRELYKNIAP